MEIKILWTDFAKSAVRSIFDYYLEHVSRNLAKKLVIGIVAETKQLQYQPTMGTLEPLLENDPRQFRYILYKSYKILCGDSSGGLQIKPRNLQCMMPQYLQTAN